MSISARSYVAAGLATAMAGSAMIGLMTAQGHIHLPNFSSASVTLSSVDTALPRAQMEVASLVVKTVADAEKVQQIAHGDSASASPAAQAAAAAASTPDAKTGTLSVLANAARAVHASLGTQSAAGAGAVQPRSAAVSSAAAAAGSVFGIIAAPALVVNIGLDVLGDADQAVADVILDISNADFALATGQTDFPGAIKMGSDSIGTSLRADFADAMARVQEDVAAIRDSLGFGSAAAAQAPAGSAVAGTGSSASAATKSLTKQGSVHANPVVKGDNTKADAPQGHTTRPGASQGDTGSADTTKVDTGKASAPSTSTVSSTSTASNAGHSTPGSSAVQSPAQSGTSVRKHRAAGASSHAGGSGANKGVGASGRGGSHAGHGAHDGHHGK